MKRSGIMVGGALGCVLVIAGAQADTPYQSIVDRNVFGLKPPTPVDATVTQGPPPPTITLEGITDILGRRQVIFKAQAPPGGQPPEKSYLLNEGESQDDIDVVAIDMDAGTVKFNNHGTEQTLDLKTDTAKPAGSGGSPPGVPRMPVPGFGAPPNGGPLSRRIPPRMMRTQGANPANAPVNTPPPSYGNQNPAYNNPGGNFNAGNSGLGNSSLGMNTTPQSAPQPPQAPAMTSDEQTILIELERERTKQQVANGDLAPLPITDLTPQDAPEAQSSQPTTSPQ